MALGGSNASTMGSFNFNHAVLEVNPNYPIVGDLECMVVEMWGDEDSNARNFAILLYEVVALQPKRKSL